MLKHFFWQCHGIIRSLSDFEDGPRMDVGVQMPNVRDRGHPLLVAEVPGRHLIRSFHPKLPRGYYERLAELLGIHYHSVVGRSTASHPCTDEETVASAGG